MKSIFGVYSIMPNTTIGIGSIVGDTRDTDKKYLQEQPELNGFYHE
jgi:hypothetical protein